MKKVFILAFIIPIFSACSSLQERNISNTNPSSLNTGKCSLNKEYALSQVDWASPKSLNYLGIYEVKEKKWWQFWKWIKNKVYRTERIFITYGKEQFVNNYGCRGYLIFNNIDTLVLKCSEYVGSAGACAILQKDKSWKVGDYKSLKFQLKWIEEGGLIVSIKGDDSKRYGYLLR